MFSPAGWVLLLGVVCDCRCCLIAAGVELRAVTGSLDYGLRSTLMASGLHLNELWPVSPDPLRFARPRTLVDRGMAVTEAIRG